MATTEPEQNGSTISDSQRSLRYMLSPLRRDPVVAPDIPMTGDFVSTKLPQCHPSSVHGLPSVDVRPTLMSRAEGLEMSPPSTSSAEDANSAVHVEAGASATPPGPGRGEEFAGEFAGNGVVGGASQAPNVDGAAHTTVDMTQLLVTNGGELIAMLSLPSGGSIHGGGANGHTVKVDIAEPNGQTKGSADNYTKVLLALFGVALPACITAYPVIKQAAPNGYTTFGYGLSVLLSLVLLAGLLATTFDKSPRSVDYGKYALKLALGLTIGLLTWSICSLDAEHKFDVYIGVAGALVFVVFLLLFHCRKW